LLSLSISLNAESDSDVKAIGTKVKNQQEKLDYIKVSSVPGQAAKVSIDIKSISKNIEDDKQVQEIHELIVPYTDSIAVLLKDDKYKNIDEQNARELQKMQSEIAVYIEKLNEWEKVFKSQIKICDDNKKKLDDYLILWDKTYENSTKKDAPKKIINSTKSVVSDIKTLSKKLKKSYNQTLTDSQVVTTKILMMKELTKQIKEREVVVRTQMFSKKQSSFVELLSNEKFNIGNYFNSIKKTIVEKIEEIKGFFQIDMELFNTLMFVTFLNFLLNLYTFNLYKKRKLFVQEESYCKKIFYFIQRPISTFTILFVLSTIAIYSTKPMAVNDMLFFILIIPIALILKTVINKENNRYIYTFLFIYLMFFMEKNSSGCELESRLILIFISIGLMVFNGVLLYKKVLRFSDKNLLIKLEKFILILFLILLLLGIFSNIYGNIFLSMRIVDGVLTSMYTSLIFYVVYIILTGYIVIMFRRRVATAPNILEVYSRHVEDTAKYLIKLWMIVWWFVVLMKFLGTYIYLIQFKNYILSLSWQIGNTTISVNSTFDFIFIVFTTWALSRFLKTFLEVEIFSRFKFPRGVPTAILTTMNYIIVISGTIIAFSSLGISAQQFAIVFGALGVGIGFGLRNIIANFVSGIIMVFERPVQIGDTIEVDGTMGNVMGIGARSSTVKTFDGAEVIIPNADFMAKEIVNWTLSNKHRRKVFEFKVGIDNDIEEILSIMNKVALENKDTLKDPVPVATFQGFEDYYMKFKLYFWLSENLIVAPSDISIAIYKALREANIKMPVPRTYIDKKNI